MDVEKVKLIVKNMESLVRILTKELNDDSFEHNDLITPLEEDYEEVYVDEI